MLWIGIACSVFIGVFLGLLGGGGSILTVPILLYIIKVDAHQAIATSLFVVGTTSFIGAVQHARLGQIDWRIGSTFGLASMVGAFFGGMLGSRLPGTFLLVFFAVMMLLTAAAMMRKKEVETQKIGPKRPFAWVLLDGVLVGAFTGMVGAGGGFLVVPALAILAGLPIRKAIGTSLFVIGLKSFAGFAGYMSSVEMPWKIVLYVTAAAIFGTFFGTRLSGRWSPQKLRRIFAIFVVVMACYVLIKELL